MQCSLLWHLINDLLFTILGVAWVITPEERAKHDQQFMSLKPVGGMVTGKFREALNL